MTENVTTLLNSTFSFLKILRMNFRQIETHYHLIMLSICDFGTFVFSLGEVTPLIKRWKKKMKNYMKIEEILNLKICILLLPTSVIEVFP